MKANDTILGHFTISIMMIESGHESKNAKKNKNGRCKCSKRSDFGPESQDQVGPDSRPVDEHGSFKEVINRTTVE
jgi:hypothetical protein